MSESIFLFYISSLFSPGKLGYLHEQIWGKGFLHKVVGYSVLFNIPKTRQNQASSTPLKFHFFAP